MLDKSIVIVNNDTDLLNIFTEALEKSGYHNISSFNDPIIAYKEIEANPEKFSLLIITAEQYAIFFLYNTSTPQINSMLLVKLSLAMTFFANSFCNFITLSYGVLLLKFNSSLSQLYMGIPRVIPSEVKFS